MLRSPRLWLLLALAALSTTACKNPLYWVWPAKKLFVSVTASRKIFELDRAGPRSTWGQIWLDSGPTRLVYARGRGTLFALLPEAKAVAEVSPDAFNVVQTLSTLGRSTDLAISVDESWAYALNPDDRAVVRIDLKARKVERTIAFTEGDFVPAAIAAHPAKADDIYVASASGSVSIIQAGLKGPSLPLGAATKISRVVPARSVGLLAIDSGGTKVFRFTEADASKVEALELLVQGGSAVETSDGTIFATAPAANKVVRIGADRSRQSFDVGGQVPRAMAADTDGVYIANEGSNQVVRMKLEKGRLHDPEVIDSLPGPPADMVAL
jgi:hypothetical protein